LVNGLTASTKSGSILLKAGDLTDSEFWRGIKNDRTHYSEQNNVKNFNTWNCGFVATAFMHHTQFVLDGDYVPLTPTEVGLFREMKLFMHDVFEENINCNAHSIYKELTKHAKRSTIAQLSGDTLLKYITSARYPSIWRRTCYDFVLQ
jgi:hypothetical protein